MGYISENWHARPHFIAESTKGNELLSSPNVKHELDSSRAKPRNGIKQFFCCHFEVCHKTTQNASNPSPSTKSYNQTTNLHSTRKLPLGAIAEARSDADRPRPGVPEPETMAKVKSRGLFVHKIPFSQVFGWDRAPKDQGRAHFFFRSFFWDVELLKRSKASFRHGGYSSCSSVFLFIRVL